MTKFTAIVLATAIASMSAPAIAETPQEAAYRAHDAYLAAINSNDLEAFLGAVTDDVVFVAPNTPMMVGKAQVAPWVDGYFDAVETTWEKTSLEFVVAGDWAFELYTYSSLDRPRDGSDAFAGTGSGINIYRLESDGVWRVARDAWTVNGPLSVVLAGCGSGADGPC